MTNRIGNVRVVNQVLLEACQGARCPTCCHPSILEATKRAIRIVEEQHDLEDTNRYERHEAAAAERRSAPPDPKLPAMVQVIQTRKVR